LTPLLTGLGLAAAAGWNAWAVLLLFNGLERLLPQDFPGPVTSFLASAPVLQLALLLFFVEFVVNKIPVVDRFWELAQTLLRPLVGALLALASVPESAAAVRVSVGLAAAAVTFGTHLCKSTTRLTSTAATRGSTQFALSLAEDAVALAVGTLVFFQPWFAVIFLAGLLFVLIAHGPRVKRALAVLFFRIQHPRRVISDS
jgi:hypothetical protein